MKPILVPVDFSTPSENAARYAVHLSKNINSNLILCHSFFVPADPVGGQLSWPLYEYSTLEDICIEQLEGLAKKLEITDQSISSPNSFHPAIFCSAVAGGAYDMLNKLIHEKKAGMIIMGMSGSGAISRFFLGSVSRQTIEHAEFPVLLVPSECKFRGIKKIALATDLSSSDVDVILSLTALAAHLDADLVVTNITDEFHDTPENYEKSEDFIKKLANKNKYDRIYYRQVRNEDIDEGLDWLIENGKIDLLAMVHRQKGLFSRMFTGSHTKKLANHVSLPLLVFPDGRKFEF